MKKILVIVILIFFLLNTNGSSDAALIDDLRSFEKSLSEWVENFNKLEGRISDFEENLQDKEKQIAGFNQSIANIENLLADLNAKVDRVEKMASLEGVKDIVKSFEGTLDVFKKRFSEMAKRLEDQEVKTAVLERIYQTSQKPLETLMRELDEQNEVVNKLAKRLEEQEKRLLAVEENSKKQTTPTESISKSVEELNTRLSKLESGVTVRKTEEKKALKETSPGAKKEKKAVATEIFPVEKEAPTKKPPEIKGFTDIGLGFFVKNVEFKPFGSSSYVNGKILNKSGRYYSTAEFKVHAYSEENVLLSDHGFSMYGFKEDSTKKFEEVIVGVEPENIAKYAIFFAEMPLVSDTGRRTIKVIERGFEVAMTETEREQAKTEKEKLTAKKAWKAAKELEDFENIGGGFFVRNVFFDSFGSSSSVTGEIKNNSKKNYNVASFVMKVFSKNYGMITSFDFSVRRLKGGEIKPFEEIISGVRPVDIARYEIAFKKSY